QQPMLLGSLWDCRHKTGMPTLIRKPGRGEYARGRLIAKVLAGSWRAVPPKLQVSPSDLSAVITPLLKSRPRPLVSWKLTHPPVALTHKQWNCPKNIPRAYSLKSAIRKRELGRIIEFCKKNQVEPVLIKGWAVARHYADCASRPPGDVDLCVPLERVD